MIRYIRIRMFAFLIRDITLSEFIFRKRMLLVMNNINIENIICYKVGKYVSACTTIIVCTLTNCTH